MTKNKSFIRRARGKVQDDKISRAKGRLRMTDIYYIVLSFCPNLADGLRKNLKTIRFAINIECKTAGHRGNFAMNKAFRKGGFTKFLPEIYRIPLF